jgi:hypothetical protein
MCHGLAEKVVEAAVDAAAAAAVVVVVVDVVVVVVAVAVAPSHYHFPRPNVAFSWLNHVDYVCDVTMEDVENAWSVKMMTMMMMI